MSGIDRYDVGELLATGGMAEVYLARRRADGRRVVVKKMRPQLASDPSAVRRFLREGSLASKLKHENVIDIIEVVDDGAYPLLVMEAVDGADLATVLKQARRRRERVPPAVGLFIAQRIARALVCAAETTGDDGAPLRIVHRDVTPSNVLVSRSGDVKLIDFGVARADGADALTRVGSILGKWHYLAPEQIERLPLDARVDVWAAGCVLYQLLGGRRPFEARDEAALVLRISGGERRDLRTLADVPEVVAAVVDRALAVDRNERFAGAREFLAAIDAAIDATGLVADRRSLAALVEELVPSDADQTDFDEARAMSRTARFLTLDDGTADDHGVLPDADVVDEADDSGRSRASPSSSFARADAIGGPEGGVRAIHAAATRPASHPRVSADVATVPTEKLTRPQTSRPRPPVVAFALIVGLALVSFALGALTVAQAGGSSSSIVPSTTAGTASSMSSVASTSPTDASRPTTPAAPAGSAPPTKPTPAAPTTLPTPTTSLSTPPKVRPAPKTSSSARAAMPGSVVVDSRPWSTVVIDGDERGTTPTVIRDVPPGRHTLVLENREQGLKKSIVVVVPAGGTQTVRVDLRR